MSYLDIWDTPESLNEALQEAVDTIWAKLSRLEKGMGPPWEPLFQRNSQGPHLGCTRAES